jgi:hypothetical protein
MNGTAWRGRMCAARGGRGLDSVTEGMTMSTKIRSTATRRVPRPGSATKSRMLRLALAALLGGGAAIAFAQKATEMFIPIGQSSGLSGKHTLVARVQSVNEAQRSLTVLHDGSTYTAKLGAQTPVWLDRSALKQPNTVGSLGDVKPGMAVEIKYQKNNRGAGDAEWVKLQVAGP